MTDFSYKKTILHYNFIYPQLYFPTPFIFFKVSKALEYIVISGTKINDIKIEKKGMK